MPGLGVCGHGLAGGRGCLGADAGASEKVALARCRGGRGVSPARPRGGGQWPRAKARQPLGRRRGASVYRTRAGPESMQRCSVRRQRLAPGRPLWAGRRRRAVRRQAAGALMCSQHRGAAAASKSQGGAVDYLITSVASLRSRLSRGRWREVQGVGALRELASSTLRCAAPLLCSALLCWALAGWAGV